MAALRIGVLGAARIVPNALVKPARDVDDVVVSAVAARDRSRADAFAAKHGITRVHDDYESLLSDSAIDAIYNPLPNGLHGKWTIAALEAGKHVLCEKPFTANADEAEAVAKVAASTGLVVMEAFHYRYHPMAVRVVDVLRSGELGDVSRVETWMCTLLPAASDIRWQLPLAGGSAMDVGCYAIHLLRTLAGAEPEVVDAEVKLRSPEIDRWLRADVRFPSGATGRFTASRLSARGFALGAHVECERGELKLFNPYAPHYLNRLSVRTPSGRRTERFTRRPTYTFQLEAFANAVNNGGPVLTDTTDAVANMRVIDGAYRAAGLATRPVTA
jgi:predicted dehydrogenase